MVPPTVGWVFLYLYSKHSGQSHRHAHSQTDLQKSLLKLFQCDSNLYQVNSKNWSTQNLNFCSDWYLGVSMHQTLQLWYPWGWLYVYGLILSSNRRMDYWSSTLMKLGYSAEWKRSVLGGYMMALYLAMWKWQKCSDGTKRPHWLPELGSGTVL